MRYNSLMCYNFQLVSNQIMMNNKCKVIIEKRLFYIKDIYVINYITTQLVYKKLYILQLFYKKGNKYIRNINNNCIFNKRKLYILEQQKKCYIFI